MSVKPFGKELLLDCYNCAPLTVNDIEVCRKFLNDAVIALEVQKQADPTVIQTPIVGAGGEDFSDKAGISAWVAIVESGIQIHTLVPKNFISIDFYTCGRLDEPMQIRLIDLVNRTFAPDSIEQQLITRGQDYNAEEDNTGD